MEDLLANIYVGQWLINQFRIIINELRIDDKVGDLNDGVGGGCGGGGGGGGSDDDYDYDYDYYLLLLLLWRC